MELVVLLLTLVLIVTTGAFGALVSRLQGPGPVTERGS